MTEENGAAAGSEGQQVQLPRMQVLGQYVRDMSFENIAAQSGLSGDIQPDVQMRVNLDAKSRGENRYEVAIKVVVDSKNKTDEKQIFLLEIEYVGLFAIDNVPQEQLHPYLMIECPRMIFPYLRRIVSDVTRDGGFMPINLEQIDFVSLYRQELQRRAAQQSSDTGTA